MHSKEEALEAAMLARMVGTHLTGIDKMTTERSSNPANKISMERFVAPLVGGQANTRKFEENAPLEVVKAYEGLNELALRSVPDVYNNTTTEQPNVNLENTVQGPQVHQIPKQNSEIKQNTKQNLEYSLTRSDIDSIRNSLKNIDKTLSNMLVFLTNKQVKNK
jgi:hypothetical protein